MLVASRLECTCRSGARRGLMVSLDPACNAAICFELSSSSFWSLATRSSMSLIFSSCWSANESLSFGVRKAFHARKTTRANATTPTTIEPFFPIGNACRQSFFSFIGDCSEQAKCQVATNDNIAISNGSQDLWRQGQRKFGTTRCKIYGMRWFPIKGTHVQDTVPRAHRTKPSRKRSRVNEKINVQGPHRKGGMGQVRRFLACACLRKSVAKVSF